VIFTYVLTIYLSEFYSLLYDILKILVVEKTSAIKMSELEVWLKQ
jgi:hypothetical protein